MVEGLGCVLCIYMNVDFDSINDGRLRMYNYTYTCTCTCVCGARADEPRHLKRKGCMVCEMYRHAV